MVQRVQTFFEDDIDGGPASETIEFALEGVTYEIDLNEDNASKLRSDLGTWIGAARRTGGRTRRGTSTSSSDPQELARMRAWGRENGFEVSDRGRVPKVLREAYAAAQAA